MDTMLDNPYCDLPFWFFPVLYGTGTMRPSLTSYLELRA